MNKWDCIKLKRFCTAKESHQTQETAHRMGENLCPLFIPQWTNIQNLQHTQKPQTPKNRHFNEEMGT
jgi:hypothetical protein